MSPDQRYQAAVSRNIGWFTPAEQERLRGARVAIAGLGGAGGVYALALARLGVSQFNIADFDTFEVHNFNRQAAAFMSTLDQPKVDVVARMVRDINPDADIRTFPVGVQPDNVTDFFKDVDVYVDGLDFFAVDARRMVFAHCHSAGIPALTSAPMGMGATLLYFRPGGMSFEDYFRLEGQSTVEQYARFIAGLSPAMLQRPYLVVADAVDFAERRGPSTVMGCELCAGVMCTAIAKVLLGRGPMRAAPWVMQFDAYRQKLRFTWRPWGNANPLQQLLLMLIRPHLKALGDAPK